MYILNAVETVGKENLNVIAYNGIISKGDIIKICIVEKDLPIEKMPVEVIKNNLDGTFEGKLLNEPVSLKMAKLNNTLTFERNNIYKVIKNDECVFNIQK